METTHTLNPNEGVINWMKSVKNLEVSDSLAGSVLKLSQLVSAVIAIPLIGINTLSVKAGFTNPISI